MRINFKLSSSWCLENIKSFWKTFKIKIFPLLLETVFPKICIGCGSEGDFLCGNCFKQIPRQKKQCCPLCYEVNEFGLVCEECNTSSNEYFLDGLIAACEFREKSLVQKSVHIFKYEFVESLGEKLSELLIETAKKSYLSGFLAESIICPVPLHKNRFRWRGFNQAEILAKNLSAKTGLKIENILKRKLFKKPQMELTREERLKNVADAFGIATGIGATGTYSLPAEILLVDDIATTTATLNACAKALKQVGVKKVYAMVLARVY